MSAAVIIARQNSYMRRFRNSNATIPENAILLGDLGIRNSWLFRRMVRRGVFIETEPGRFYMDESGAKAFVALRIRKALLATAILTVVALLLLLITQLTR